MPWNAGSISNVGYEGDPTGGLVVNIFSAPEVEATLSEETIPLGYESPILPPRPDFEALAVDLFINDHPDGYGPEPSSNHLALLAVLGACAFRRRRKE